jgi:signal transduction histidine kinase
MTRVAGRLSAEIALAALAGIVAFAVAALVGSAARDHVSPWLLGAGFLLAVAAIGRLAGILYGLPAGVGVVLAYDWYFLPPLRRLDPATLFVLGLFLSVAVLVGALATHAARRAVASEAARGALADEQAALRRVATLVAREAVPSRVFDAVADEVARLLGVDVASVARYEADATATVVAVVGSGAPWTMGSNWPLEGDGVMARVFRTRGSTTVEGSEGASRELSDQARAAGIRWGAGAPILLGDRLWGAAVVASATGPVPAGAAERIGNFAELVAIAISNAETRTELTTSRARVVTAGDQSRQRLERDLHDGIQQRLVTLVVKAAAVRAVATDLPDELRTELSELGEGLLAAVEELREIARGIHPSILSEAGLGTALKGLARRCPVPVQLQIALAGRTEEPVEVAAYYVVSEALTNVVKHARASVVDVRVEHRDGAVHLSVHDDGIGGVDATLGSGLVGLRDRVEAMGGQLTIDSPRGSGTTVAARLPTSS